MTLSDVALIVSISNGCLALISAVGRLKDRRSDKRDRP
jgi:hypothetical protein